MNVMRIPLARTNALTQQYIERNPVVSAWFDGHADAPGADEARLAQLEATAHTRVDREALADVLLTYNARFAAPEAVQAAIAALRDPHTVAVVGGQQPGLLSGELLVMAKAIHVIEAARAAEQRLARRVVPVFWIAGEDHDWEEVDHLYIGRAGQSPTKVKLSDTRRSRLPLSAIALTAEQQASVLDQLTAALPDSLHKREVLDMVRNSLVAGESITDAFARVMMNLFGKHGLILIDAADPGLRELEGPFIQTLLSNTQSLHTHFQQRRDELALAGFAPQVDLPDGQANVFVVHDGERMLLDHDVATGGYVDRKQRYRFTAEALRTKWEAEPTSFSTNVVTRPLMQEHLFPVLRTVVGAADSHTGRCCSRHSTRWGCVFRSSCRAPNGPSPSRPRSRRLRTVGWASPMLSRRARLSLRATSGLRRSRMRRSRRSSRTLRVPSWMRTRACSQTSARCRASISWAQPTRRKSSSSSPTCSAAPSVRSSSVTPSTCSAGLSPNTPCVHSINRRKECIISLTI